MDQDATWYGGRPRPRRHCIRWGPGFPHIKGHSSAPPFRPMSIVAKRSPISATAKLLCMLRLYSGGFATAPKPVKKFMDFCAEAPVLISVPMIYLTLMTYAYVIRTICCTAFFQSLPSGTVTLPGLVYTLHSPPRSSVALNRLQFYYSYAILSSLYIWICMFVITCLFLISVGLQQYVLQFVIKQICYVVLPGRRRLVGNLHSLTPQKVHVAKPCGTKYATY